MFASAPLLVPKLVLVLSFPSTSLLANKTILNGDGPVRVWKCYGLALVLSGSANVLFYKNAPGFGHSKRLSGMQLLAFLGVCWLLRQSL